MLLATIINLITITIAYLLGFAFGKRKQYLLSEQQRLNDYIRCPELRQMYDYEGDKSKSAWKMRCELDCGHIGPHKIIIPKKYSNRGDIFWWEDKKVLEQ